MQNTPQSVSITRPNDIEVLEYMGKDTSKFRTINLALSTLIGATGYNYYSQLGISEIKGGSGIWFNDYLTYLIAAQNSPAKLWGILNNKYVVMGQNSSLEGLSYIGNFKGCKGCAVGEAYGPYLYRNELFLPRYYIVPNSILIAGDNPVVQQLIYSLMLQNFEPKNTVLIQGTKINDYSIDFLKKFNIILLVRDSVDQSSIGKLREYAAQGGIIVPDILNGQNTISNEQINSILNKTSGNYKEINIELYSNNKVVLWLNGEKGWLVASERFAYFPGWKAGINGKNAGILKANNAVSAVYLNGEKGKLVLEYEPDSYKKGKLISITAVIFVLVYFGYYIYRKKFRSGGTNQA